MITAPFNFVPLSDKVFFPPWAEDVSHDIPFKDGESGEIDITITAKSPIFIRDHENPEEFCSYDGEYYIPSTSVKGMIRSVLEIMSFGKLKLDTKKHTKITSVRDMTNREKLVGTANGCGFLKKDNNDNWIIIDYGKPRTIKYTNQNNKIIQNGNSEINCNFETAQEKYEENELYQIIHITQDSIISNYGEEAYLILTGGIDNKKHEFVFASSDRKDTPITDIEQAVDKFKKVYFESDSIDGNFWKDNYDSDIGIPIFYKKNGNKVTDIGLSQLFKLAYNYTIDDATKQIIEIETKKVENRERKYNKLDLAETIFGAIQEELAEDNNSKKINCALKGRVQFSHFKCNSNPEPYKEIYTVLGSPNPSFYPEYIEQNCQDNGKVQNDRYNTLMDERAKIAGWKRYPLRYGKPKFTTAQEGTDSATRFTPIGTYNRNNFNEFTFTGKLRYHNLKKVELGALISALTFHNNEDKFYHNIGMGKSLGFGKIKIDTDTSKYQEYLIEYEMMMNKRLNREWIETEQIRELFIMAYKDLNIDNKLKYLNLDPENKINEFVDKKKNKECLPKVSQMFNIGQNFPKSLLTDEILQEREEAKKAKEQRDKFVSDLNRALETQNIQILQNFIKKYPNYEKIEDIKSKRDALEQSQQTDRFLKVDEAFKKAYNLLQAKKGNQKQYKKELDKFTKKWSAEKNNKKSPYIIEKIKKLK